MVACLQATAGAGVEGADEAERLHAFTGADEVSAGSPGDPAGTVEGPAADAAPGQGAHPWHREPRYIMMRSIAVPGWGQLANGRPWKALLIAAGETYFIWRAVHYGREERELRGKAGKHPEDSFDRADLVRRADYAGDRRRDSVWWAVFSAVFSMGDAYVDAHLGRDFEVEFEPQDLGVDRTGGREVGFRVGIRRRLW